MKTKSIMLIAVSLGFGLIAAIGMSQVLGQKDSGSAPQVEMVQVYVASKSLEIGDDLKLDENLNVKKRPITDVPENAIKTAEELENMVAIQKVPKDVLIVGDFIRNRNEVNLGKQPPKGFRAFTIKTELVDTHHNSIQAGDRIDIVGVFKGHGRDGREVRAPSTFLKNIEVWQVNDKDYIGVDSESNEKISTITVLLTPKQVEVAILAQDIASVVRVVKTNREAEESTEEDFDLNSLAGIFDNFRDQQQPSEESENVEKGDETKKKSEELINDLNKVAEQNPEDQQPTTGKPKKIEYKHRMTIYKGGQVIKYGFGENSELPTVISQTASTLQPPVADVKTSSATQGGLSGSGSNESAEFSEESGSEDSDQSDESNENDSQQ